MTILARDYLAPGEMLGRGEYLVSRNGRYYAALGADGDLCVFAGTPMKCAGISWRLKQPRSGPLYAIMQKDGNFCVYWGMELVHQRVWCASTQGQENFLIMQDDGNLCIYAGSGPASRGAFLWGTLQAGGKTADFWPLPDVMAPGAQLFPGTYIPSANGAYFLTVYDGDLCVFAGTPANCRGLSWRSNTHFAGAPFAVMQEDGNFCLYGQGAGDALFCTGTSGHTNFAVLQADGNLCVYAGTGHANRGPFRWGSLQNGGRQRDYLPALPDLTLGLNSQDLRKAIETYGPVLKFHPQERYLMCSVESFLQHARLHDGKTGAEIAHPTTAQLPAGEKNDGRYWLILDDRYKGGDLSTAKAYVHALFTPGCSYTDIQFWFFYAYNGPGTAHVNGLAYETIAHSGDASLAPMGEHYGDWECCMLRIDNMSKRPVGAWLSQHDAGQMFDAGQMAAFARFNQNQIVVYASKNGHAVYSGADQNLTEHRKYPSLAIPAGVEFYLRNDTADGGRSLNCAVHYEIVSATRLDADIREAHWLSYPYRWGPEGTATHVTPKIVRDVLYAALGWLSYLAGSLVTKLAASIISIYASDDLNGPVGPKTKGAWTGRY